MGAAAKKKKKTGDFAKVKLKVGRRLKKATSTDTSLHSRRLVLVEQLRSPVSHDGQARSHRGLTVDALCRQLGHPATAVRTGAIVDLAQLLVASPGLVAGNLHVLVPAVGRLLSSPHDKNDLAQLRALFHVLCSAPSRSMSPHFPLLLAHVLRALSHLTLAVRTRGLVILDVIMSRYGELSRASRELFPGFLMLLASPRQPSFKRLLPVIATFLDVFAPSSPTNREPRCTISISFDHRSRETRCSLMPEGNPYNLPVLTSSIEENGASPLERLDGVIALSTALSPLMATACATDGIESLTLAVLQKLAPVLNQFAGATMEERDKLKSLWRPVVTIRVGGRVRAVMKSFSFSK